ncbi:transport between ER and Golgi ATPase protein [Trapelia coarctata]|nr:transport between ER and Golgi ATPase protein [Trapelia coarctata]
MSANLPAVDSTYVDLSGITATSENPYDALLEACENDAVSTLQCDCQFMHVPMRNYRSTSISLVAPYTIFSSSLVVQNVFTVLQGFCSDSPRVLESLVVYCFPHEVDALQAQVQLRYDTHRKIRNEQQRAKLLAPDFSGFVIDPILFQEVTPRQFPGFTDPRHCLVFWARPPKAIRDLIHNIQQRLLAEVPNLWLMPPDCLHMTTLEVTHSLTAPDIDALVQTLKPKAKEITDYPLHHRARLVKPMISYDSAALALSFVPAAGDGLPSYDDTYTYHHLRRDLYGVCKKGGVTVASRYTVPSSHLTIARFVTQEGFLKIDPESLVTDPSKVKRWIEAIDASNRWLEEYYWPKDGQAVPEGGEWIVGQEKGLDFRRGTLWYGGGETVRLGMGF